MGSSIEQSTSSDGQRAHVTLLFSDLCDFTALGEVSDPEEADALRRDLEQLAAQVIGKHHGVISQCYGDGILAVFGLPVPDEHDSRRAVEAALELHAAARGLAYDGEGLPDFEVRMHSGVHAGLIFARAGDTLHGQYDITGDAVNTASRLAAAAGRDEILVSDATLRGLEAFFATEPALELALKGKRAPMVVHRVVDRSAVRTRFEARSLGGLTPFAGRRAELDRLMRALDQARLGEGQLVLVSGAAGIGKTRTLEEFRLRASNAGVVVLSGGCDSYGEIPALEPFLQILKQLFGIQLNTSSKDALALVSAKCAELGITEHAATLLRLLSVSVRSMGDAEVTALSALRALGSLIDAMSRRFSIALLLDDWQWADQLSQKVLLRISRVIEQRRVLLLVGIREDAPLDALPEPDLFLHLEPFSSAESRRVIGLLRAKDLDVGLTSALHTRSGGNPLFLEELCRSLSDEVLWSVQALEQSSVPNTLQGLIQARIAKLTPSQSLTLQRASVIGLEFESTMLASPEQRDAVDTDLSTLVAEGLLYPAADSDNYRFKHGIAREVVYGSVRIQERRRIHHEIATALEDSVATNGLIDQSEALAFHYRGSGDHERAARHAERAGDKAAASSFLEDARAHYEAALASLDRMPPSVETKKRWLRICEKWAAHCAYAPVRAQLETLRRADGYARELENELARAHKSHMLGWFYYVFGDYAESLRHNQEAFAIAERLDDAKLLTQLWTSLGQAYSVSGQYTEAMHHLTHGIELKRARSSIAPGPPDAEVKRPVSRARAFLYAHSLTCRAMIHADLGAFEDATRDIDEAREIVLGTGHAMEASVLSHHSIILLRRGDWEGCREVSQQAAQIAERVNSVFVFGLCSAFESYARWRLAPNDEELRRLRTAVDWLEAREFGLYISFMYSCLAEALCESGEIELARAYAERAIARARVGDPQGEIPAYRVLARAAAVSGDPDQTPQWLDSALRAATARGSERELALTSACALELRMARGDLQLTAADTVAALDRMGMRWYAEHFPTG